MSSPIFDLARASMCLRRCVKVPVDARMVANFFLDIAEGKNVPLTTLSLLKLLYYAHGWYLVAHNRPLVKNRFEAWQYGPVIKVIYDQFKQFKNRPIESRAYFFDPVDQTKSIAHHDFSKELEGYLENIFEEYSRYHPFVLSNMTHVADGPWDTVWNNSTRKINLGMVMENNIIKQHFRKVSSPPIRH